MVVELVFKSYYPLKLEKGMWFIDPGTDIEEKQIFSLSELPEDDEKFMKENGAPVELFLIDSDGHIVAQPEEIGWWDDGDEDSEELYEISLEEINNVIQYYEGYLELYEEEIEHPDIEDIILVPLKIDNKVILTYLEEEDEEDEEYYEEQDLE